MLKREHGTVGEAQALEVNFSLHHGSVTSQLCDFKQITLTSPSLSFLIYKMCYHFPLRSVVIMMLNMVSAHNECFPFPRLEFSQAPEIKWQELARDPKAPYSQQPDIPRPCPHKKLGSSNCVQQRAMLQRFESKSGGCQVVHTRRAFRGGL